MKRTLSLILFGLLAMILLSSCVQPLARHDCLPESLIVDETVFPEGTIADIPISPLPDGGGTSIGNDYGNGEIDVTHLVYPYQRPKGAENAFEEELNHLSDQDVTSYDLSSLQLRAEQFAFICSSTQTHPRCSYIAQYDNYYIRLILRTPSLDTSVDVLIPAIQDIDNRMMKCFEEHPAES